MRLPWTSHTLVTFLGRRAEQPDEVLVSVLGEKISSLRVLEHLFTARGLSSILLTPATFPMLVYQHNNLP